MEGIFYLSHRLLGLDFPKMCRQPNFGHTVRECNSENSLCSRGLHEDGGCVHASRHVSVKSQSWIIQNKEPNLEGKLDTPWTIWTSISSSYKTKPKMVYSIWWRKVIVILILMIRPFGMQLYDFFALFALQTGEAVGMCLSLQKVYVHWIGQVLDCCYSCMRLCTIFGKTEPLEAFSPQTSVSCSSFKMHRFTFTSILNTATTTTTKRKK